VIQRYLGVIPSYTNRWCFSRLDYSESTHFLCPVLDQNMMFVKAEKAPNLVYFRPTKLISQRATMLWDGER
jgi:hypothetical protein